MLGLAAGALLGAVIIAGCNTRGEETVADKDFATSSTVKTAVGSAGSTFAAPMMASWVTAYHQMHPTTVINYRPIGSGAGISEFQKGFLAMAASDAPLSDDQIAKTFPVVQVPVTAGPVCVLYNVPGLTAPLRFSASTLAGIFLGNIISWQDPAIAHDNPGVKLPHAAIIVVHRSEGSGTTSIFTNYLTKVSPEWAKRVGAGIVVGWPVGIAAEGNKGVSQFVKANANTIGYGELNTAKESQVAVASIQNRAGTFVAPSPAGATAAIEAFSAELEKDPRTPIVDAPASAKDAYPLAGMTFMLIPKDGTDADERQAVKDFVEYAVTTGQDSAGSLDYAKLPKSLQQENLALLNQLTVNGQALK